MANIYEPSDEEIAATEEWIESRPEPVKSIAKRLKPWKLYRMKGTGQRVTVYSISENGTVTVDVSADHNLTMFERQVFGISPDDLEECDLPDESEVTGALMSHDDVEENIDMMRATIRPDLFALDKDGKAVRKA